MIYIDEEFYHDDDYKKHYKVLTIDNNQYSMPPTGGNELLIVDIIADREKFDNRIIKRIVSHNKDNPLRIARPIPLCSLDEEGRRLLNFLGIPKDCSECVHFLKLIDGEMKLCSYFSDVRLPPFEYFNSRSHIYSYVNAGRNQYFSKCLTCDYWDNNRCNPCKLFLEDNISRTNNEVSIFEGLEVNINKKAPNNRVTIFFPPIPNGPAVPIWPSLGAAYLDAAIRDEFDSTVVDSNLFYNIFEFYKWINVRDSGLKFWRRKELKILYEMIDRVESTKPDYLGVSSWSYNMPFVAEFINRYRARNPDVIIILGGVNPSLIPEKTLEELPQVDYLIRGEGEITFKELLISLRDGKNVSRVKGISFLKDNEVQHTPDRPPLKDLDRLNYMDYENFLGFRRWHKHQKFPFMQVMTSRGCIARCSFCTVQSVWGGQRFYSKEYVRNQLDHLWYLYDFSKKTIGFMDDNFVVNNSKTIELIDHIQEKFPKEDFDWEIVGMRADMLNEDLMAFMNRRNCTYAGFGVESMNKKSLIYMNKCLVTPQKYREMVFKIMEKLNEYELRHELSSIIGLPEESEKDMINQANFFVEMHNNYKWSSCDVCPLVIHPKTPMSRDVSEGNLHVYRRPAGSAKRFYEGLFADKYEHLLHYVPNAYRVANETMTRDKFEFLLHKIFKEKINHINVESGATYGKTREYIDKIGLSYD